MISMADIRPNIRYSAETNFFCFGRTLIFGHSIDKNVPILGTEGFQKISLIIELITLKDKAPQL